MKNSAGILALYLALCHATPGWDDGKMYTYDYELKYGTGISDDIVTQFAGRGIRSRVQVQYANNKLMFKYVDIKTAEFNRKLSSIWEDIQLDYQRPSNMSVLEKFERPFYSDYEDGKIIASYHETDINNLYYNIERSLLSLFQIQFPSDQPHDHYYILLEDGIGGKCNTTYIISHVPTDWRPNEKVLNLTKHYWYDQCINRPHQFFSSMDGYKCPNCQQQNFQPYRNLARVDYGIRGNKNNYTIERIDASGVISITPFTTSGQTALSITNQTLRLLNVDDTESFSLPSDVRRIEGLHFRFNIEDIDYNNVDLNENIPHIMAENLEDHTAEAEQLLPLITPEFSNYHSLAKTIQRLGLLLYFFNYDRLESFYNKNVKLSAELTTEEIERRNFMLTLLPILGTNPAIKYALDIIQSGKIPNSLAVEIVLAVPFYAKTPTAKLVDRYLEFVKSDMVNDDKNHCLYSMAWLSLGTLIYKACIKHDFNPHPPERQTYIGEEKCNSYVDEIIERFHSAQTSHQQSVYLRALVNTRTEKAFHILIQEVIPTNNYNTYVRATALWGLEHHTEKHNEQVMAAVLPILADLNEDYQLRIYAFDILLRASPHPLTLTNFIINVLKEPEEQLASYIYSTLINLVNSTDPCNDQISKQARRVLPYFINRNYDVLRHSTNKMFSFYNEQYGFGRTSQFILMGSNDTFFPRGLYMRQAINLMGYNFDVLELGGIQRKNYMMDSYINLILNKLNLFAPKSQSREDATGQATYEMYARIFNQDLVVSDSLNPSENIHITPLRPSKVEIHYNKILSGVQMYYIVPNLAGHPTVLSFASPLVLKLSGAAELVHSRNEEQPALISANLDLKLGAAVHVEGALDILSPAGPLGYKLHTDASIKLPIRREIILKAETGDLTIKDPISIEPYDLLYYNTQPLTYIRNQQLPVKYADSPIQRQYKIGHNFLGAGLKVYASSDYRWNEYGTYSFIKSFFQKSRSHEDYVDLIDRYYAGSMGLLDYALLNPIAKPFHLMVRFERSTSKPADELVTNIRKRETPYYNESRTENSQAWTSQEIDVEITAKGPVERKWNVEIKIDRHWPINDLRRLNFHYKRSALPNYDKNPYEVCLNSEAKIEGIKEIIRDPLNFHQNPRLQYEATLNIGSDCGSSSKRVKFHGEATRSDEQNSIDKPKLAIYKNCKRDYAKDYEYSLSCWRVKQDQGRLDHYTLDVEYSSDINPNVKDFFYRIYYWFHHTFYNNFEIARTETGLAGNRIRIEADFSYMEPVVDIQVTRPQERVNYRRVFVPSIIPQYEPITIVQSFFDRYLRRVLNYHSPVCFLSGDYIYTLDGVQYKYPLGSCYHIAIANCLSKSLVLSYKTVQDGKYSKAMKLMIDNHSLEIIPEAGFLVVRVDGETILADNSPAYIKRDGNSVPFVVYKKFNGFEIDSRISGLIVYFDGRNSKITVSNFYRGQQCGMCGDFNGNKYHEFRSDDGTLHKDGAAFANSYTVRQDGC